MTISDLDIWMRLTVPAVLETDFTCMIPFPPLKALSEAAGDAAVLLSLQGETLTAQADDLHLTLRLLNDPVDFPDVAPNAEKALSETKGLTLGEAEMHRLLHLGAHCISDEETRYYLNGTFLTSHPDKGTLRGVATDGHRMAVIDRDTDASSFPEIILHKKTCSIIRTLLRAKGNETTTIHATEERFRIEMPGFQITSKLIDGKYPDYTRVIPSVTKKNNCALTSIGVNRLSTLGKAISNGELRAIALDLDTGKMIARDQTGDSVELPLQATGAGRIGINAKYLRRQMRCTPTAKLYFDSPSDAALLHSEDPNALWVMMPIRA